VPKDAGFPDVKKLAADRGIERIHWNQGSEEDREVAERTRSLLQRDLTQASAVEIALLNNPRLQATYERLGVAQADLVQAGLLRNPTLAASFHFPVSHAATPAFSAVSGYEFSIVGEFLDLLLMPIRKRFARAEFERAKLEVASEVIEAVAQVRTAFYTVEAAQQMVEMRRTIAQAGEASAELAGRQHHAGNLSNLDLASEQATYAQARLDLARAEADLVANREQLNRLLGVWGRDVEWKTAGTLAPLPDRELPLEHVESVAIDRRLDLKALRSQVEVAAASLSLTKHSRFVNAVSVGGHYDKDPEGVSFAGPNLELQLPIFDQGQAQVARLQAELRQTQRLLEAKSIEVRSEVRAARARLLASRATVSYYRETLLPLRERIVKLSQEQYNAMLVGVYQLLAAKQNEANAYREYIESLRDYWIARAELERAAGGALPVQAQGEQKP
jgi:cobalt-zinc-cadmium efflux system outer membrane protein